MTVALPRDLHIGFLVGIKFRVNLHYVIKDKV